MVNIELLFSRIGYISLFFTCVFFLNVYFFPTRSIAENLYTYGGTVDLVDGGRLVVNDSNHRLSKTIKYLDKNGVPVDNLGLKKGDYIIFQANTDGEIVQITASSSTKAQTALSPERVQVEAVENQEPEGQQGELKLKNGVWAN